MAKKSEEYCKLLLEMRIAIIGINFSPEMTGCGPYTTDLSDNLHKMGHDVTVISGLPHYPEWKVPKEFKRTVRHTEFKRGYQVIRLWHFVPKSYSTLKRIMYEITFAINVWISVSRKKFDVVVAVSPSLLSLLPGIWLKKNGASLKVLAQDLISPAARMQIGNNRGLLQNVISKLESILLKSADSVGVISETFLDSISEMDIPRESIQITENYSLVKFEGLEHAKERERWGWSKDKVIVMYTGTLGIKQGLTNLVEAAKLLQAQEANFHIVIVGDGSQKKYLQALAQGLTNLEFRELVPNEEYASLLISSDILLVHEGAIGEKMSMPSKLESYIESGRPIFAVCSDQSSTYQHILKHSIPHCRANSPEDLIKGLKFNLRTHKQISQTLSSEQKRALRINWVLK